MPPPASQPRPPPDQPRESSTAPPPSRAQTRGSSFPFSFGRSIRPNPSATSLVSSTAEGKPIPVDDSTAKYRTTALRELNHHYPSRHRYVKTTGAQSSTYSEPVIVRSYSSPLSPSHSAGSSRGGPVSVPGSHSNQPAAGATGGLPFISKVVSAGNGMLRTMVFAHAQKKPANGCAEVVARLPPVEAFRFRSFMANMEAQGGGASNNISADLDRIAEICARSRYSLSNQYEVHYTPHGSGASFLAAPSQSNQVQGPTLQAVPSDDDRSAGASSHRRRHMARRNSRAMGTLETIMSSNRSSEDEKPSKKTAAELAEEVRGRAARKESGHGSPTNSSRDSRQEEPPSRSPVAFRKSASSLALIDATRHNLPSVDPTNPHISAIALVSEPALPQESKGQLEIRTASGELPQQARRSTCLSKGTHAPPKQLDPSVAKGAITPIGGGTAGSKLLSIINGWIPWRSSTTSSQPKGLAEGSLRELLKSTDIKGKGLERIG